MSIEGERSVSVEGRLTNGGQVVVFATDPIDVQD